MTVPSDHADREPFLAHHFDTPAQQFFADKLGMWLFLVTEILLFGGLFVAYAVYRAAHPEVFQYADQFLSRTLGAINTCILLVSSLTMAWAVHCAQCNQRRGLILLLSLTLVCACGFLGIKYVEYRQKWEHGLLWARYYKPVGEHAGAKGDSPIFAETKIGTVPAVSPAIALRAELDRVAAAREEKIHARAGKFFSIYFLMTGLHGIHVLAGMGIITWVLIRSIRCHFSSRYYAPVDNVGLYWHLVDLIWIYLFPLLYLIH